VQEFADIYEQIERDGERWQQVFEQEKPGNFQRYVQARQAVSQALPKWEPQQFNFGLADLARQFAVLCRRALSVLFSEPLALALLLLLPVTGLLQLIVASREVLTGNPAILGDPVAAARTLSETYAPLARTNLFLSVMGLAAVLTGMFAPSTDLLRERSVYLRERMVNLRVVPYLLSKTAIYSLFAFIQVALYLLIFSIGIDFPARGLYFNGLLELFITLFLAMLAGITFGFVISAASRSTEMATSLLGILLLFHFFFGGALFDLRGNVFEPVSYLSSARWATTALGVTIDMPRLAGATILCSQVPVNPGDPNAGTQTVCQNDPNVREELALDYNDDMLLVSWGMLLGMSLLFLITTGVILQRTKAI
jgi:hypothetical protein